MEWRIIIEFDTEQLSERDVRAMVENFKRHIYPRPRHVWYECGGWVDERSRGAEKTDS